MVEGDHAGSQAHSRAPQTGQPRAVGQAVESAAGASAKFRHQTTSFDSLESREDQGTLDGFPAVLNADGVWFLAGDSSDRCSLEASEGASNCRNGIMKKATAMAKISRRKAAGKLASQLEPQI